MDIPIAVFGPTIGVIVGWALATMTRHFDEVWFGAQLKIECQKVPGNRDETPDHVYMKLLVQNTSMRRVAKHCRAYIVELHQISNAKVVSENLISDTFQLSWAGYDFEARDIPAKVKQYVDLVRFSKHEAGWIFVTKPAFYNSLKRLANHRGTYRFTGVVAGDGAVPQTRHVFVDYDGDWKSATPYD